MLSFVSLPICRCEDSEGEVCGKVMKPKEFTQDGMCAACADNVWAEMNDKSLNYMWKHEGKQ